MHVTCANISRVRWLLFVICSSSSTCSSSTFVYIFVYIFKTLEKSSPSKRRGISFFYKPRSPAQIERVMASVVVWKPINGVTHFLLQSDTSYYQIMVNIYLFYCQQVVTLYNTSLNIERIISKLDLAKPNQSCFVSRNYKSREAT